MTTAELALATTRLEELERYSDLHEESLRMLREWLREVMRRELNKIVDINEWRYWRRRHD